VLNGGGTPTAMPCGFRAITHVTGYTINYKAAIDDPKTWTKPWKIAFPLTRDPV
jgi:hypothetical protein